MSTMAGTRLSVSGTARKAGSSPAQRTVLVTISDIGLGAMDWRVGHRRPQERYSDCVRWGRTRAGVTVEPGIGRASRAALNDELPLPTQSPPQPRPHTH